MTACTRREVVAGLRGLVEAVGVVAAVRGLEEGMVRHVAVVGRQVGRLLLRLEAVVLSEGVVRLVLEVLGEAGVGEVCRVGGVVQASEGVGGQQVGIGKGLIVRRVRMRRGGGRVS